MMDAELAQELVNELGSSMESLEAQHGALVQFLKDKGVVTDEEFGPYLERAAKSAGVRWRAARVRLDHLLEAEKREAERAAEKEKEPKGKKPADELGELGPRLIHRLEQLIVDPSCESAGEASRQRGSASFPTDNGLPVQRVRRTPHTQGRRYASVRLLLLMRMPQQSRERRRFRRPQRPEYLRHPPFAAKARTCQSMSLLPASGRSRDVRLPQSRMQPQHRYRLVRARWPHQVSLLLPA